MPNHYIKLHTSDPTKPVPGRPVTKWDTSLADAAPGMGTFSYLLVTMRCGCQAQLFLHEDHSSECQHGHSIGMKDGCVYYKD